MCSSDLSEVYGVALWAFALIWLIALVTRSPTDPVWFFNSLPAVTPANFAGRFGAFLAEASLQLLGYTAFLIPPVLSVVGWHAFWCRPLEARYTKITGVTLLVLCVSGLLGVAFGVFDPSTSIGSFPGGGVVGAVVAHWLKEALNTTGAVILLLTLLGLALVLSTQFSFGHASAQTASVVRSSTDGWLGRIRAWQAERARAKERAAIVKKHTAKAGASKAEITSKADAAAATLKAARQVLKPRAVAPGGPGIDDDEDDEDVLAAEKPAPRAAPAIKRAVPMPAALQIGRAHV